MSTLSPEGQRVLACYVDRGWFDANGDTRLRDDFSRSVPPRPAYLVIASGMLVLPRSEVQITARCNYRSFRCTQLVVASEMTRRFDLIDLKVMYRSQFRSGESLPLRDYVDEATPELIQWPLDICRVGGEISAHAIIPAHASEEEADLGAAFELILLGEVI
jgi:hypothetical protein